MANKFGLKREDFASYEEYRKEYNRLLQQTDERKLYQEKYRKTDSNKKAQEKWRQSDANKLVQEKWRHSDANKLVQQKYWQSEKGRSVQATANVKRRAALKRATPPWSDTKAIKKFYDNTPKGKTVHHEYALQGENFSGLHILSNLRYVTKSENSALGNRLPKEY